MADDRVKYSEALESALASTLDAQDVFALAQQDADSDTGYVSKVTRLGTIAQKVAKGIDFSSDLYTFSNNIIGAINEVYGHWWYISLTVGDTSSTITDENIHTLSTFDFYTSVYDFYFTSVTVTEGQLVLTFPPLTQNIMIKVRIV